jgi:aldose 1-epimerase
MLRNFGTLPDGTQIHAITLEDDHGLRAEVLTYGGILRRLQVPAGDAHVDVVLGLPDLPAYLDDHDSLGILVGRFGNRIAGGRFVLDGVEHQLSRNEGANHLHGGIRGFGHRLWQVREQARERVLLGYVSPAGEEGYPGTLEVTAEFRLQGQRLELIYRAHTDAATPINLTHHPYFNLAGDRLVPAAAQVLRIQADHYLPVDAALIPTGQFADVYATPFDFRIPGTLDAKRMADDPQLALGKGYDHCLVLNPEYAACTAELYSPHSGVAMRLTSSMPAVQLYEGQMLDNSHPELGRGVCLEPQQFPDAPNHAEFPNTILRPGEDYLHRIEYRFGVVSRNAGWDEVADALDRAPVGA